MLVIWASYQSRDLRQINTTGKSPAAGEMLSSQSYVSRTRRCMLPAMPK
jgi:hypothetical protein